MTIEANLAAKGLVLPQAIGTEYAYTTVSVHGATVYLAGHIAKTDVSHIRNTGAVDSEVRADVATKDAGFCMLQGLASIKAELGGLETLARPLSLMVYVNCAPGFEHISAIADGASDMLISAFGQTAGRHPRSVMGVAMLPRNAPVMIDARFALGE